jgi:hypothetical protein
MLKLPFPYANLISLMPEQPSNLFRELPSVDRLLKHARCEILLARYNREYVTSKCREIVDELRADLRRGNGHADELKEEAICARVENRIRAESQPGHVRVINASGTILHTNLGRALLPQAAIDAMTAVGYREPEYDLTAGKRGSGRNDSKLLVGSQGGSRHGRQHNAAPFSRIEHLGRRRKSSFREAS